MDMTYRILAKYPAVPLKKLPVVVLGKAA